MLPVSGHVALALPSSQRVATLRFVYPAVAILIDWLYFDRTLTAIQMASGAAMSLGDLVR